MKIYNQSKKNSGNAKLADFEESCHKNLVQVTTALKGQAQRPWYLVLGPKHSGKASLLNESGIAFTQVGSQDNKYSRNWVCDSAVFVAIGGESFSDNELHGFWNRLMPLLKSVKRHRALAGIILTLNLHDLLELSKLQRDALLNDLRCSLAEFTTQLNDPMPIYCVFTHLDLISGFVEYFNFATKEDREQPFGFSIVNSQIDESPAEIFEQHYGQLLKQLSNDLIKNLHQVHDIHKRVLINEFPLQMESLRDVLQQVLKTFFNEDDRELNYFFRGSFFVSSQQEGIPIDRLSKAVSTAFALTIPNPMQINTNSRPFFSKHVLEKLLPDDFHYLKGHVRNSGANYSNRMARYAAIALITVSGITFLSINFMNESNALSLANASLVEYRAYADNLHDAHSTEQQLRKLLPAIDKLAQANRALNNRSLLWQNIYPLSNVSDVQKQMQDTYQSALKLELLPALSHYIENHIDTLKATSPGQSYAALKAYLMLGYPQYMQSEYFINWCKNQWHRDNHFQAVEVQMLADHLAHIQRRALPSVDLNLELVKQTRAMLNTLPKSMVAFFSLKNQTEHRNVALVADEGQNVFLYKDSSPSIPYIYTKAGFVDVYQQQIKLIAQSVHRGDWVLGRDNFAASSFDKASLENELLGLYVTDYVNWWQSFFANTRIATPASIDKAQLLFRQLADHQSPLNQLLLLIGDNTSPMTDNSPVAAIFNDQVASNFQNTSLFNAAYLQQFRSTFKSLQDDFLRLEASANSNAIAFDLMSRYFTNGSQDPINQLFNASHAAPSPLKEWLEATALNTVSLISNKALNHVNEQWITQVLPEYTNYIENRYPLNRTADQEITPAQFQHFFSTSGSLAQYFDHYVKPFVDTESPDWQLKQVNGVSFSIQPALIQQFIIAKLIRKMFFNDDDQRLSFSFTLSPLNFAHGVKDVVVDLDGQTLFAYPGAKKVSHFVWPGRASNSVTVVMDNNDDTPTRMATNGFWAVFRLLDKSQFNKLDDNKRYQFTLLLNNTEVGFELVADKTVNPFIPGILNQFNLPSKVG